MTDTSTAVVVAGTGELIALDSPTDVLADAIDRISTLERELREAKKDVSRELLARMDFENLRKHQAGTFLLEAEAPDLKDYDADELAAALATLVAAEKISDRAMGEALERVVSYKPRKREIDKLLKSPTLTAEDIASIEGCAHPRTRDRALRVKRA